MIVSLKGVETLATVATATTKAEPALAFDHVTVRFGGHTAVANASITIGDGEFVSIVGPTRMAKSPPSQQVHCPDDGINLSKIRQHDYVERCRLSPHQSGPHTRLGKHMNALDVAMSGNFKIGVLSDDEFAALDEAGKKHASR